MKRTTILGALLLLSMTAGAQARHDKWKDWRLWPDLQLACYLPLRDWHPDPALNGMMGGADAGLNARVTLNWNFTKKVGVSYDFTLSSKWDAMERFDTDAFGLPLPQRHYQSGENYGMVSTHPSWQGIGLFCKIRQGDWYVLPYLGYVWQKKQLADCFYYIKEEDSNRVLVVSHQWMNERQAKTFLTARIHFTHKFARHLNFIMGAEYMHGLQPVRFRAASTDYYTGEVCHKVETRGHRMHMVVLTGGISFR